MQEFLKGVCVLVIFVGAIVAAIAWFVDRPDQLTRALRVGCPAAAVGGCVAFLLVHFRRDKVPDYLHQHLGGYFDRGGFCFAFTASVEDGVCWLDAFFQNRYDRPCVGRIALRPARGLFGRRDIEAITYEVRCDPGAFGVARVPLPIPATQQGKRQKFEVGASVQYPEGKGQMLRFRDGAVIRTNSNFGNTFGTALTVAGALGGVLVISRPESVTIDLPICVAEDVPGSLKAETKTLWKLGVPALPEVA